MRRFPAACAALGLIACTQPARADIAYPWCAEVQGSRSCAYSNPEQCRAAISGNLGFCGPNPTYHQATTGSAAPRRRR